MEKENILILTGYLHLIVVVKNTKLLKYRYGCLKISSQLFPCDKNLFIEGEKRSTDIINYKIIFLNL